MLIIPINISNVNRIELFPGRDRFMRLSYFFMSERAIYGIMVPQSYGFAARKRSLNHDVRFYVQRNRHNIV